MKKIPFIGLFCLLLAFAVTAKAQTAGEGDELLQLLRTELKRNYDSLRTRSYPPYFMAYRVHKAKTHHVSAKFGHIYDNSFQNTVYLTIELRVGKPETDNYHYLDKQSFVVNRVALPLDDNPVLVRTILQRETERVYRESVVQYADNLVKATIYGNDSAETEVFHFQPMDMDQYYEPPVSDSHWDADDWASRLRHCTSDASLSPDVTDAFAEILYQVNRDYLVNSENSFVVQNHTEARLNLHIERLADDNTLEHLDYPFSAPLPEQLPDAGTLLDNFHVLDILTNEVCNAPSQTNMECPLWLTDQAAATLIHNLVGHALENPANGLFAGQLQQKVLPEAFSVISDPTKKSLGNHYLNGGYIFDDEGVKSQRVTMVNHGTLERFFSTRTQCQDAYSPNGHARGASGLPSARQSNLVVETDNPLSREQLEQQLQEELHRQKAPFGIRIVKADIVCDTAHDIVTLYPTLCYRHFSDGTKQMIRDIRISASPQQWLDNLMASGDFPNGAAITCHSQGDELPTHCVTPDLLFRRIPVRHAPKPKSDRMIAHLSATQTENDGDPFALFHQVAQDMRDIDEVLLKVGQLNAPYYQSYLMTDVQVFTVEASGGSVFHANQKDVRKLVPKVLVGNDLFNNDNLYGEAKSIPSAYGMSTDDNYESFARDFRLATESEYRKAIRDFALKESLTQPRDRNSVRERSDILPSQIYGMGGQTVGSPTMSNLEHFACEASAELAKKSFLENSGINIYVMSGYHYFWGSDKVKYSEPVEFIGVQLFGSVRLPDGQIFTDAKTVFLPSMSFIFNLQGVQSEMNKLLAHLETMRTSGISMAETYNGPVLVEGDAVGQILAKAMLEERPNLLAYRESTIEKYGYSRTTAPHFEDLLDKIITSKNISVTANKNADEFGTATFCRHCQNDAEGAEAQETEIIRNGELVALMGNRTVTKSTTYSNGFQRIAINQEAGFGTRGTSRLDFSYKNTVSHSKLKSHLLKEAKKQGLPYAYIIRSLYDNTLQNVMTYSEGNEVPILQLCRVDVRTGKETPVADASLAFCNFSVLNQIIVASKENAAYPVMVSVRGATGTRDFPFAGVPTCIVSPDGLLLKQIPIVQ